MQPIQYLYNETGKPTAMYIDLENSKLDNILKKPLNKPQIEILKLLSTTNEKYLADLKKVLAKFLMEKIFNHADEIWEERGYTKKTFDKFVEND